MRVDTPDPVLASGFVEVMAFACPRCGEMFAACDEADGCDDPACPGK